MKAFIILLLLCLTVGLAHAQVAESVQLPVDPDTHRITYTGVVQVPGVSQAELYTRAKLWFADAFKSAKEVVQADEKDAGVVQGRGWSQIAVHMLGPKRPTSDFRLWQTVKIMVKDGRYRYEVSGLEAEVGGRDIPVEEHIQTWTKSGPKYTPVVNEYEQQIAATALATQASLQKAMVKPVAGKDW